ncbi:MAG: chorismate lyase [Pseudomonadota bacterium]
MHHSAVPHWRPLRIGCRLAPPPLGDWLADPGSLTRRLVAGCPGGFRLHLLHQSHDRPWFDEQQILALSARRLALCREIRLLCQGHPLVFARSIIPLVTLAALGYRLSHLGEKSLGSLLFSRPDIHRQHMEVARLVPRDRLFRSLGAIQADSLWARRTLFSCSGHSLLVCEVFLPGLPFRLIDGSQRPVSPAISSVFFKR